MERAGLSVLARGEIAWGVAIALGDGVRCKISRNFPLALVFNGHMKRAVSALAAIAMAAVIVPATASAADLQIGVTASPLISPTCPANAQGTSCKIVLTQVTAYETRRDGVVNPDTIKQSGVISAFTLGLAGTSLITPKVLAALDKSYGGPPEAQLTVLRATGTPANPSYRVAAESAVVKLRPELGRVAEFPLVTPLPVVRGEILALTVPTWAPVLSFELDTTKFAYVQGRAKMKTSTGATSCDTTGGANLAQIVVGELSTYGCSYPGTRIEYSALEITTPAGFTSQARKHRKR
jgi:hypothetical protein